MARKKTAKAASGAMRRLAWLVGIGTVFGFWLTMQFIPVSPDSSRQVLITVEQGNNVESLADILVNHRVVRSRIAVYLAALLTSGDMAHHLVPGEYYVTPAQTSSEILTEIGSGRTASQRVIFPEGFTLEQDAQRLQERGVVNAAEFLDLARHNGLAFHAPDGFTAPSDNLEGFLFPDEYDFGPDSTARSVIQTMLDRFDAKVVRANPGVTDWQTPVTIASMVERETSVGDERPMIAGVIYNRLNRGMMLQIDATVQYALPEHQDRLMYSDLKVKSPYNTYLHKGLPPGAICNPGLPSIEASLAPDSNDYLYYVQGMNGRHFFGKTYAEQVHNIAIGHRGLGIGG